MLHMRTRRGSYVQGPFTGDVMAAWYKVGGGYVVDNGAIRGLSVM